MADDGRSVAWLGYLPLPGLGLVAVALRPDARLVRFHAWQGTLAVLGLVLALFVVGLLARISDASGYRTFLGFVSGVALLAAAVQLAYGVVQAVLGRYARLRPWWDLAAALRRT